jgi:cytochrome c biogenesis protein CcdA
MGAMVHLLYTHNYYTLFDVIEVFILISFGYGMLKTVQFLERKHRFNLKENKENITFGKILVGNMETY